MLLKVLFLQQRHLRLNIYKMKKILAIALSLLSFHLYAESPIENHHEEYAHGANIIIDPDNAVAGTPIKNGVAYGFSTEADPTFLCPSNLNSCEIESIYLSQPFANAASGSFTNENGEHVIYKTNVKGIGYSLEAKVGNNFIGLNATDKLEIPLVDKTKAWFEFRIIFVYTGEPIPSGNHNITGPEIDQGGTLGFARLYADTKGATYNTNIPILTNGDDIVITTPSCEISSDEEFTIDLGEHNMSEFAAVGETAGEANLQINLKCKNGVAVSAVMTDQSFPGNTSDILTLTDTSTAKGVGIQFFHKDDPKAIVYGPDNNTADQSNKWYIATADKDEDLIDVNLTAKYVRTGDITAGEASGIASVTFIYE